MAATTTTKEQETLVRDVYAYAARLMQSGMSEQRVLQHLVERGLPTEAAAVVVANLSHSRHEAAASMMMKGWLWLIGGLVVTLGSIALGNGSFIITWGAILYGIVMIARASHKGN